MKKTFLLIRKDIKAEWRELRLQLLQAAGAVKILLACRLADIRAKKYYRTEKKICREHGYKKMLYMNFNVMIMQLPVIKTERECTKGKKRERQVIVDFSEKFTVCSDNEIIELARKRHYLPKRITQKKMQKKNSIFYHTEPKMSYITAVKNYNRYLAEGFKCKM